MYTPEADMVVLFLIENHAGGEVDHSLEYVHVPRLAS